MSGITVEQLRKEVEELKSLRDQEDSAEEILSGIKRQIEEKKQAILACLQENNLENFKVPGVLQVSIRNEFYVKQPESAEEVSAFNQWLQKEGLEDLRKVNSQTLNKLYRERLEAAAEQGEIVDIPGLQPPTTRTTLTTRKG